MASNNFSVTDDAGNLTDEATYGQNAVNAWQLLAEHDRRLAAIIGIEQIISDFDRVLEADGLEETKSLIASQPLLPDVSATLTLTDALETLVDRWFSRDRPTDHDLAERIIYLVGDKWQKELIQSLNDWLRYTIEG